MIVALLSFGLAAVVLIVLPGPDTTVVLRAIVRDGRYGAALTAAGVCCGLLLWLIAAAAGLSALLAASRTGYDVLKIAGACYLAWLGVHTLVARRRHGAPTEFDGDRADAARPVSRRRGFVLGLTTDLLNPKVGVFFVSFLPQFVPHTESVAGFTVLLGALYIAGTAVWFAALVRLAARVGDWLSRPRVRRWLERATGTALLGFAASLLAEAR